MGHKLNRVTEILIQRLEKKGVEHAAIPWFMRDFANITLVTPDMNLAEVNRKLHSLGWNDFELDDHTLQLIIASLETEGVIGFERRFNSILKTEEILVSAK